MFPTPPTECRRTLAGAPALRRALLLAALAASGIASAAGVSIEKRLSFGHWSPFGSRWESESPVCVWSEHGEHGERGFRVTASGSLAGGRFALSAGPRAWLDYRVFWYPEGGERPHEEMTAGQPSRLTVTADPLPRCGRHGARALVRVSIDDADLDRAPPGAYQGALVLTLSPL